METPPGAHTAKEPPSTSNSQRGTSPPSSPPNHAAAVSRSSAPSSSTLTTGRRHLQREEVDGRGTDTTSDVDSPVDMAARTKANGTPAPLPSSRSRSLAPQSGGSSAQNNGFANDSLGESAAGSLTRPPFPTTNPGTARSANVVAVPPQAASPRAINSPAAQPTAVPKGDSFAFPPDLYKAMRPTRKRSVIITGAATYQAVADNPRAGRSRSYLVPKPPQQQSQGPTPSPAANPAEDHFYASQQQQSSLGRPPKDYTGGYPGDSGTTAVSVSAPGSRAGDGRTRTTVPPTAVDPARLPPLAAAYFQGDLRADLLSANDPINNYTFFIGGSDTEGEGEADEEEDSSADGLAASGGAGREAEHCPFGQRDDAAPPLTRLHDSTTTSTSNRNNSNNSNNSNNNSALHNPVSLHTGGPRGPGAPHAPYGSFASADGVVGSDVGARDNASADEATCNSGAVSSPGLSPAGHVAAGRPKSQRLDLTEAAALVESMSRSFALNRKGGPNSPIFGPTNANFGHSFRGPASGGSRAGLHSDPAPLPSVQEELCSTSKEPTQPSSGARRDGGPPGALGGEQALDVDTYFDIDAFARLPMPERELCYSRADLNDDTVSFTAVWQSVKSEAFSRHILSGFRTTLFAVMPMFVLTKHPNTRDWFSAGALVPIIAGLMVRGNLGAQVWMTIIGIQACIGFLIWGTVMNAVGAVNHVSGWWCGIIFAPFAVCLLGDLMSKRLMMMYIVIVMQMEHMPGGSELVYPSRFAKDFLLALVAAFIACLLPWPILAVRQLSEAMIGLHKLYGAGVGNAMKAYWAPVNIDQKVALSQVPFAKIRDATGGIKMLMHFNGYEPTEFNLNNILRGERLAVLQRIKMHLYQMSAAASQRIGEGQQFSFRLPKEMREFESRVRTPAMELGTEIILVLTELGKYVTPEDVATEINYDTLYNKASILSDIVDRERAQTFFLRQANPEDTNSYLRTFAFLGSLLDIAAEIEKLEIKMRDFDPAKYLSFWRRSFNFLIGDMWRDFWVELPKRLTLATPRDVRIVKDAIRYTLGFAVACAFTLNYDHINVYYFGMAILMRLAQQTASETLSVGIYRICGLCIGASISYITTEKTHNLAEETLLTMTFVFIALCLSTHPVYQWGAQYVMVTSITSLNLAPTPALLLVRIVDNVFAFISYFLICTFIFPIDPIRVLWNTRVKIFLNLNELLQHFVTLGCCPITSDGAEASMFITQAKQLTGQQALLLKEYGDWMPKCAEEPIIRGGAYPAAAVLKLLMYLTEAASLEETMLDAMVRLHRVRSSPPSVLLHDVMELIRPFLLDAGKIMQRFFQSMIDATETPKTWSMETTLSTLWKGQIACRSLRKVTGNIQRNFYATVQQLDTDDKQRMNVYLPSSMVFEALAKENDPRLLNPENEEMVKRLFAMSFHMSQESLVSRDDMQAFNVVVTVFELMLKVLEQMLPFMVEIHEFEKSRVI